MDSTIDMSKCAKEIISKLSNENTIVHIASDNEGSVNQVIITTLSLTYHYVDVYLYSLFHLL